MKRYQSIPLCCYTTNVLLEYIDCSLQFPQMLDIAINIYFTLTYYAGSILNVFSDLSCSKLCWHNRRVPSMHI